MVIAMDGTQVGMIVDEVSEVLSINDLLVEPPPEMATTVHSNFIVGIAKVDTRLVIMLDLREILSLEEQSSLRP